jgi:hypothetical protein
LIADVTPGIRTGRASTAVVCLALLCLSGCRLTEVWSGVRTPSNGSVQLAAKTPLCSCIVFENRSAQPVFIESSLDDASTGNVVVPAQSTLGQRFDWAGPEPNDFYILRAWTGNGSLLRFGNEVTFSVSPWEDCAKAACEFAPMMMNVGLTNRNPGDR